MISKIPFGTGFPYETLPWRNKYMSEQNFRREAEKGVLHFYYKIDGVLEKVFMLSSYEGKVARSENGETRIEEVAMNKDDMPLFETFLRQAQAQVFERLASHTKWIDDAYGYDETYEGEEVAEADLVAGLEVVIDEKGGMVILTEEEGTVKYLLATKDGATLRYDEADGRVILDDFAEIPDMQKSVRYTLWWKDWMNENALKALDDAILEGLVNYVMSKWLAVALPAKSSYYGELFAASLKSVTQRLNTQKHDIRRPYVYF